jgi:sterol 3beta-glucosyltransferase
MRVGLATWGSRGDHQPFLALAEALVRAGHEVRLGGYPIPFFAEAAAQRGVTYIPLCPQTTVEAVDRFSRGVATTADPMRQMGILFDELVVPSLPGMYEGCLELARWSDVLVSHYLQPAGQMAAEKVGVPFATITLFPPHVPRRWRPPPGWPSVTERIGRAVADVRQARADRHAAAVMAPGIDRVRRRAGLPPIKHPAWTGFLSTRLNLVPASPRVVSARGWAPRHRLTGYWYMERPAWTPPPELEVFINGGAKPVAFVFGQNVAVDLPPDTALGRELVDLNRNLSRMIVEVVRRTGVRGIVQDHWFDLGDEPVPPGLLRVGEVAHEWLFPRMAAVVHHGGMGTAAATFRAGAPAVFIPEAWDRRWWGETAVKLGVAAASIWRADLTTDRLVNALNQALSDTGLRQRAARLGASMAGEDGLGAAVRLIERFGQSGAPLPAGARAGAAAQP